LTHFRRYKGCFRAHAHGLRQFLACSHADSPGTDFREKVWLRFKRQFVGCIENQRRGRSVKARVPASPQESGVVDDELQVVLALSLAPADKVLARLEFPGARAKAEQGHQSLAGEDVSGRVTLDNTR
jgi:hypothetical protein